MSGVETIVVGSVVKETDKSLRIKAQNDHNYNITKDVDGWEQFKTPGATFSVETEKTSFMGDRGPVSMTWIRRFEPVKTAATVRPQNITASSDSDEKARSMGLAYAKDLAVAGKIPVEKIVDEAVRFAAFITGASLPGILQEKMAEAQSILGGEIDDDIPF